MVVVEARDVTAPAVVAAGRAFERAALASRQMNEPITFIVALFQWGWGQSVLGFTSVHSVASWLPLFLFVVLFGLSMDYHVFILSRIREAYDRTGQTGQAVAVGSKTTAGVVTAAAVVMVFVFLTFATLSMIQLKEMDVGLAVAVLLDATVVRAAVVRAAAGHQDRCVMAPGYECGRCGTLSLDADTCCRSHVNSLPA
ncbi:MAG: MMPL family transporter [Streptosporangiaceae bacterium]